MIPRPTQTEVQALAQQVADKDNEIQALTSQLEVEKQRRRELWLQTLQLHDEIQEFLSSRAYRLTAKYWTIRERLLPTSGRASKVYNLLIKAAGNLFRKDPASVSQRILGRQDSEQTSNTQSSDSPSVTSEAQPPDSARSALWERYAELYTQQVAMASNLGNQDFVPLAAEDVDGSKLPVKALAFYLPQFHPIPENDVWWGRGFTEWTNVSKAIPQFVGQYQPRWPGELGFYDLRVPDVQRRQIELAKKYGIYGFCIHYYWFNGKRLLEAPLEQYMNIPGNDFPFCLCWANENWTRRWDGQENEVLISQSHTPENDIRFIQDILPILEDSRYIRMNGRPLLVVYRANLLPDIRRTVDSWRNYCLKVGMQNPYLVAAQSFGFHDPRKVGFDAAVEFPPHTRVRMQGLTRTVTILNPSYSGTVVSYPDFAAACSKDSHPPYKLFKTVFPAWDNEARKPGRGLTFAFSTPDEYRKWLRRACEITLTTESDPEKRLVFINAWNEWGEGAYLEPDRRFGYAYLEATAKGLKSFDSGNGED